MAAPHFLTEELVDWSVSPPSVRFQQVLVEWRIPPLNGDAAGSSGQRASRVGASAPDEIRGWEEALVASSSKPAPLDEDAANSSGERAGGAGASVTIDLMSWDEVQAELLDLGLDASGWGEGLWCFNPGCTNLEGPSELLLKTYACGGGCGVRYCSRECQAQGWRDGHREACGRLAARRAQVDAESAAYRGV